MICISVEWFLLNYYINYTILRNITILRHFFITLVQHTSLIWWRYTYRSNVTFVTVIRQISKLNLNGQVFNLIVFLTVSILIIEKKMNVKSIHQEWLCSQSSNVFLISEKLSTASLLFESWWIIIKAQIESKS